MGKTESKPVLSFVEGLVLTIAINNRDIADNILTWRDNRSNAIISSYASFARHNSLADNHEEHYGKSQSRKVQASSQGT